MSNPWDTDPVVASAGAAGAPWDTDPVSSGEPKPQASWWDTIKAVPGVVLGQSEQAIGGAIQAAGERVPTPPGPSMFVSKLAEAALSRIKPTETDKKIAKVGETVADIGKEQVKESTPDNLSYWQNATLSGVSSTIAQAPALAASIVTRNPAPAVASASLMTAGSTYAESRAAGADPERAATHATIDMAAEAAFEYLPTKFLTDNASKDVLKLIVGTYAREIPSEIVTTAVQSANARLRDQELKGEAWDWKAYGQDLLDTLGATIVSAPLTAGLAKGISRATQQKPGEEPPAGTPPPDEIVLPEVWLPPGEKGTLAKDGTVNQPLIEPSFDEATVLPDSMMKEMMREQFLAIDPDTIDEAQLAEAQTVLKAYQDAKDAPPLPDAELAWSALSAAPRGSVDLGEISASAKQTANAANYTNSNVGERLDRIFSFATDQAAVGKSPRQVATKPGVYVLGQPTIDRPESMLKPMLETTEQWRQRWMPASTIVISNEQLLTNSALGWHFSIGDRQHMIVPAVLRKLTDTSKFNVNTLASAFYNLSHEFGHALVKDRFYEGSTPETAIRVANESKIGVVTPEALAGLPELQRKVVEEYNAIRQRIIDGSMNAEEFVRAWLGPAKLGRDFLGDLKVAPVAPAMEVGRAIARRAAENATIKDEVSAQEFRDKMLDDIFSLDEYLAEQMSRYAYARKLDQSSALGKFLEKGLESLRRFFAQIKGDGIVAPGTSFAEWLDGLPQVSRLVEEKKHVAKAKEKSGKQKVAEKTKLQGKDAEAAAAWAKKNSSGKLQRIEKSGFTPLQNLFNTPELKSNTTFAWRSMGAAEFVKLLNGEMTYSGDKAASKGNFLAGIPESAGQFGGKGRYLVEFGKVRISGNEGLVPGSTATKDNISNVWKHDGSQWVEMAAPYAAPQLPAKKVKKVEHQVRADTKVDYKKKATGMINLLVRDGTLEKGSQLHEEALALIESNDKDEFFDLMREITGKTVKFEFDGQDDKKLSKIAEWRADKFRSRYFKAWFGDWENSPQGSSVVRIGAFDETQDGGLSVIDNQSTPPLVSFMSRSRLAEGQIYYASTLRGAHYAESVLAETSDNVPSNDMVPVVLNIRNPYVIADASIEAPPTLEMRSKGYDGIVYRNNLDGDLSFVVFDPEQIKVVDDRRAYQGLAGVSMELDIDQSTPTGRGAARLLQSVGNFLNSKGPMRRALRRLVHYPNKILQIQQLAHIYPDLVDLSYFNHTNTEYVRYGASRRVIADRLLQRWERMGKRNVEKVNRTLLKEAEEGKHWFELAKTSKVREGVPVPWYEFRMTEVAKTKLKENGIDIDTDEGARLAEHIVAVKNSLLDSLNEDEIILFELLAHRYANSPKVMQSAARQTRAQVHDLRKAPYFPQGRFGNMMLTVEKKKAKGPGYEVVWKEAFKSETEWQEAYDRAVMNKAADERIRKHTLTDSEYVLMSVPIDFLDTVASELGLSEKQIETLTEIARPVKNERLLKSYDLARLGIKGYTTDAMRSYANFTWHHSNAQAKLLHGAKFNVAIGNMRQRKNAIERSEQSDFTELRRVSQVLSAMETAKDYLMSPPNEAQTARAIVSLTYLGLNVKTAAINLYGLVTVWSDMIGKFGTIKGQARMLEAAKLAGMSMKLTDLNDRRKGNYLPPDIQKGLDRAIEEGVLSQSYAYHLAGAANASNLNRMPGYQHAGRIGQHSVDLAMFMFRLTELATRRISFVAALQEHLEKSPGAFDQAYRDAVTQVNILQNDYSSGNRVPFMRGGRGPFGWVVPMSTIFMSFAQHMAFHGYGGYELGLRRKRALDVLEGKLPESADPKWFQWGYGYTARIWLLTLFMAGYEGLPGMENILDLIEVIWRKIGKKPLRQELRELIQAVDGDPVQWSRGLAHDLFGLGFDVSRSMGFGRLVPGTDVLGRSKDQSAEEMAGALGLNLMGPTGGLIKFGFAAFGDDKSWGEKMQKLPGGIGNIWNAYYWSQHGVLGPNEGQITLEKQADGSLKPRDLTGMEIAGKALGFNPTIVSQNREILWNQYDMKMYYQGARQILKRQYWDAMREQDQEAIADVKKAISDYNARILEGDSQHRKMRITGEELQQSIKAHRRQQKAEESGKPIDKRSRGIYEDVRESYDRP